MMVEMCLHLRYFNKYFWFDLCFLNFSVQPTVCLFRISWNIIFVVKDIAINNNSNEQIIHTYICGVVLSFIFCVEFRSGRMWKLLSVWPLMGKVSSLISPLHLWCKFSTIGLPLKASGSVKLGNSIMYDMSKIPIFFGYYVTVRPESDVSVIRRLLLCN